MSAKRAFRGLLLSLAILVINWGQVLPQSARLHGTLVVSGYAGEASIVQVNGRTFVDLDRLAEIINARLENQGSRIVLSLPNGAPSATSAVSSTTQPLDASLSREFAGAAIESLGEMREWASVLVTMIKNGYPVGNAMTEYRGRAAQSVRMAAAAATTPADNSALQLLSNEFNNVQLWSDKLVKARNSMDAAKFAMSDDALRNEASSQKILRCWQFLGPMLTSGTFQDEPTCH